MRIYVTGETDGTDIVVESIYVETKEGKEVQLSWDETDIERKGKDLSFRGKGVYIDDNYANGRLEELKDCKVTEVNSASDKECTYITLTEIELEDNGEKYKITDGMPFKS